MFDEDQRGVELLLHALDQGSERLGFALGDPRGRLVEAKDARCHREHGCQFDDTPGSGRQLGDEPIGVPAQPEEVDQLGGVGSLRSLGFGSARQAEQRAPEWRRMARLERELHRLAHGELREQGGRLERAPEPQVRALVGGQPADIVAEELDPARARDVATDRVEQCRLTRAVRADQPDHRSGGGADIDRVDRDDATEAHGQAGCREHASVGVDARPSTRGDAPQRRRWRDPRLCLRRRQSRLEPVHDRAPEPIADLGEAARDVQQDDEQPDARREERDGAVARPERGQADDPQCSGHCAGEAPEPPDHRERYDREGVLDPEEPIRVADRDDAAAEDCTSQSRNEAGNCERGELRAGR